VSKPRRLPAYDTASFPPHGFWSSLIESQSMQRPVPPSSRNAFTLIELILVLVVIAIALGTVAPSLSGSTRTQKLRDTAEQFVTLTRLARLRAMTTATPHRVVIDTANRRCVLAMQVGLQFTQVPGDGDVDREFDFPDNVTMQIVAAPGGAAARDFVDFLPTGRSQPAVVRVLAMDDNEYVDAACATPTESFRVLKPGEAP
jgi:type II secretion system protein H